jgi:hypothetical protein
LHSPILNHEEYKNIEEALNEFLLNFIGKKWQVISGKILSLSHKRKEGKPW